MAEQLACFLTPITGDAMNGYKWESTSETAAKGMSFSGSIDRLPDGTQFPTTKDYEHSGDPESVVTAGLTVVYATGDETNIATLAALPAYHLFWTMNAEPPYTTPLMPTSLSSTSDLDALRDYIAAHTGKTNDQIIEWFSNKFEVPKAGAVAKATGGNRLWLVSKMMNAMRRWSDAKTELDAIA